MTERDPYPAAPGTPPTGGPAFSGAGASAVGAGATGPDGEDAAAPGHGRHGSPESDPVREDRNSTAPQYSTSPVTVRRPDALAALLLVLAGIAAAVSLLLDWAGGANGWDLVEGGLTDLDSRSWPPPAVVLAGAALLVLGLLALLPARSHRIVGVLALLATLLAAAGVVVTLDRTGWAADALEAGFWVAAAVPVLGLLGALKAMLTGPRVR